MFALNSDVCKMLNPNFRVEMHGEEQIRACDIKLRYKGSNDVLS